MSTIASLKVKIGADLGQFNSKLSGMQGTLKKNGEKMKKFGRGMSTFVTAPIIAMGVSTLKAAGDFEAGMNRVSALTGLDDTSQSFKNLTDQAKELGSTTAFSASEAADAMGFLAMAGFDAEAIYASMPATLNLAAASQMDLGQTADIVSNIMTGYGLSVDETTHATDVLVRAMTSANTDLNQLGQAMKYAGPVASQVGLTFEEAAASIGLMGNAGIQSTQAGTTLRGALARLVSVTAPAENALTTMAEAYEKSTGQALRNADGTRASVTEFFKAGSPIKSMSDLLGFLSSAQKGVGDDAAFAALNMEVFGLKAGPGMSALVGQGKEALDTLTGKLEESGITAESVAAVQMEGFNGSLKSLKSAFEGLQIAIGDSGLLELFTGIANGVANWFRELTKSNPEMLKMGTIVAGVAALVGPLAIGIGALMTVISPVALAITGLAVAGTALVLNWDKIKSYVATEFPAITTALTAAWDLMVASVQVLWVGIKLMFAQIVNYITTWVGVIAEIFEFWFAIFQGDWGNAWTAVKDIMTGIWDGLKTAFKLALEQIKNLMPGFLQDWLGWTDDIAMESDKVTVAVEETGTAAVNTGAEFASSGDLSQGLSEITDQLNTETTPAVETLTETLDEVPAVTTPFIEELEDLDAITGTVGRSLGDVATTLPNLGTEFLNAKGELEGFGGALEPMPTKVEEMKTSLSGWGESFNTAIGDFRSVFGDVGGVVGQIEGYASNLTNNIIPQMTGMWQGLSGLVSNFGIDLERQIYSIAGAAGSWSNLVGFGGVAGVFGESIRRLLDDGTSLEDRGLTLEDWNQQVVDSGVFLGGGVDLGNIDGLDLGGGWLSGTGTFGGAASGVGGRIVINLDGQTIADSTLPFMVENMEINTQ